MLPTRDVAYTYMSPKLASAQVVPASGGATTGTLAHTGKSHFFAQLSGGEQSHFDPWTIQRAPTSDFQLMYGEIRRRVTEIKMNRIRSIRYCDFYDVLSTRRGDFLRGRREEGKEKKIPKRRGASRRGEAKSGYGVAPKKMGSIPGSTTGRRQPPVPTELGSPPFP